MYLYRGEQYDSDLMLYYLRARYFNPLTGRFVTRDPDLGRIKAPVTLHKYLYAGADPVNRLDPTGRGIIDYAVLVSVVAVQITIPEVVVPAIGAAGSTAVIWASLMWDLKWEVAEAWCYLYAVVDFLGRSLEGEKSNPIDLACLTLPGLRQSLK